MQTIFDSGLILARKARALAAPDARSAAFLMERAAADLAERLSTVARPFARAVTLNCLTDDAGRALRDSGKAGDVIRIESIPDLVGPDGMSMRGDALPLEPRSVDLVASLLALQDVNDLPGVLVQIRRALRPDGLFLAAMIGGSSLQELRECLIAAEIELTGGATPRVAPMIDVRDAGALLQRAGFALPVADAETLTVRYASMFGLLADLKAMGAANALADRSRKLTARSFFARAAQLYAERFSDPDGRVRATFEFIWMSGWAPHESQQKPLKPGSAKVSLAAALGAKQ